MLSKEIFKQEFCTGVTESISHECLPPDNVDDVDFQTARRTHVMFARNPRPQGVGRIGVDGVQSVEERLAQVADDGNFRGLDHGIANANAHDAVAQDTMRP